GPVGGVGRQRRGRATGGPPRGTAGRVAALGVGPALAVVLAYASRTTDRGAVRPGRVSHFRGTVLLDILTVRCHMKWLRLPNAGEWAAITTVVVVGVILAFHGGMFSPGALNAQGRSSRQIGGVSSHADLSNNCAACHATVLSRKKMGDRCLACHE